MAVKTRKDYFGLDARHRHDADRAGLAPGLADHRLRRPAEQGGRRRQRVRACLRHPPGRRAEGARHLRDHARRGRRLGRQQDRARQALGPQRVQAAAARSSASRWSRRPTSTPPSPASRSSPTARATSSTRTSSRSRWTRRVDRRERALPAARARRSTPRRASGRMRAWRSPPASVEHRATSDGNGPVDASLKAIESKVAEWRGNAALFGQCDHLGQHRIAGRSDGAAAARRPGRQRRRRRSRHRRRVGQGLPLGVEQAPQQDGAGAAQG